MPSSVMIDYNDEKTIGDLNRIDSIFRNNGYDPEAEKRVSMKDAMAIQNAAFLIPRVLTRMVQEGIEPMLIGTSLLQRIEFEEGMQTVFPAIEPLIASEVGDEMDLPFVSINMGGAQSHALAVARHGIGLKIADKFIRENTYPWINYWLRLAGNALARHKEENIFSFISSVGLTVFNNDPASRLTTYTGVQQPTKGATTGRNFKGQLNGSMTLDDIFDMYAQVMASGFIPDTMLVHPMTWLMWVKDPVLREFAIQAGGGSFFANWSGNPAAQANTFYNWAGTGQGVGQQGKFAAGHLSGGQQSTPQGLPQNQNSAPILPSYLGIPFRILVTPFAKFDAINRTTDILMFDSKNLGALVVQQDPQLRDFNDPRYNLTYMGIDEIYGMAVLNEAQGVAIARNVKVRPNEFVMPARSVYNLSDTNSTFQSYTDPATKIFDATTPIDVNAQN